MGGNPLKARIVIYRRTYFLAPGETLQNRYLRFLIWFHHWRPTVAQNRPVLLKSQPPIPRRAIVVRWTTVFHLDLLLLLNEKNAILPFSR